MLLQYLGDQALQMGYLRQMALLSIRMVHYEVVTDRRTRKMNAKRLRARESLCRRAPEYRLHISGSKYVH